MANLIARHGVPMTLVLAASIGVATAQPILSDPRVERVIEGELWEARAVDANDIDVAVTEGIATLSGTVDNILAQERAVRIAQLTRGVLAVVDEMTVRESDRSDAAVEQDLQRAFTTDAATDSWEIVGTVENGGVTLTGTVQSAAEKRLAERVAKSVAGVRSVDNELAVEYGATRMDPEIEREIDERLAWDVRLDDFDFDYETFVGKADREIEEDIESELFWSPFVDADEVAVSVEDGVATLTGAVDDWHEWRKATENAREGGAYRVRNELGLGH